MTPAILIGRKNRFTATVDLDGRLTDVHIPTSGRLGELIVQGHRVMLRPAGRPNRITKWDLVLIEYAGTWVSIDSLQANRLFGEAVSAGHLPEFSGYTRILREVFAGNSRIDFCLEGSGRLCYVEVKSVTLVEDGVAMFPDAPTDRGRRHLEELEALKSSGIRACVVFMVQRSDACCLTPNHRTDAPFARTLARVAENGVEVLAYSCRMEPSGAGLKSPIPVLLTPA